MAKGGVIRCLKSIAYGFVFGFASPVPGISAGSLAIILNVYESFFSSISVAYVQKNLLPTIIFLVGWAAGLLGVSSFIMFLLENYNMAISFSFMGLIIGCLPVIYKKATAGSVKKANVGFFFIAFAVMLFFALTGDDYTNSTLEQLGGISPALIAWVFFASTISSMAMLVPGVGGSLMMLVFGIYALYIEAVSTLNPVLLITFGISMVLGVLAGIVITKKILELFSQALYFAILGFIAGSLFIIYPGFILNAEGVLSIILAIGFAALAYWFSTKETTKEV